MLLYKILNKRFQRLFAKSSRSHQRSLVEQATTDPSSSIGWRLCKDIEPSLRGRRQRKWTNNATIAQNEVRAIGERFAAISNDLSLKPTEIEAMQLDELIQEHHQQQTHWPFTKGELARAVHSMNRRGAAGDDGISLRLLHHPMQNTVIEGTIRTAMTNAYHANAFPDRWKCAKVITTPKGTPGEYRPISLLSTMGKLMERVITMRLRALFFPHMADQQHGCRSGHNTQQALMRFVHAGAIAAAGRESFGTIAFDFTIS